MAIGSERPNGNDQKPKRRKPARRGNRVKQNRLGPLFRGARRVKKFALATKREVETFPPEHGPLDGAEAETFLNLYEEGKRGKALSSNKPQFAEWALPYGAAYDKDLQRQKHTHGRIGPIDI